MSTKAKLVVLLALVVLVYVLVSGESDVEPIEVELEESAE
jgi:hypothetical protein